MTAAGVERVRSLIDERRLDYVPADPELVSVLFARAEGRLRSARRAIAELDLEECPAPIWDAARLACAGILQAQGLRASSARGHHVAVIEAVSAQFGSELHPEVRALDRLRRERRDSEYPLAVDALGLNIDDVTADFNIVTSLLSKAQRLAATLQPFE